MTNSLISRQHNKVERNGKFIVKTSITNYEKLHEECAWYAEANKHGVDTIKVSKLKNGYKMDFIEGDNLGEVFWGMDIQQKKSVIDEYNKFIKDNIRLEKSNELMTELLIEKFNDRVDVIKDVHKVHLIKEIAFYKSKIEAIVKKISSLPCVMHGDLFLGNTIRDAEGKLFFIDPRGLSKKWGVFGNAYYELIKLAHSIHGKYDLLIFNQSEARDYDAISQYFFTQVKKEFKLTKEEILIGEMGLFISMLPIHSDDETRQNEIVKIVKRIFGEL